MMHFNRYPESIVKEIERFAPVAPVWAYAARIDINDIRHHIVEAVLAGLDPVRAVPAALKIRKINGVWRSVDAVCMAGEFYLERHDSGAGEHDVEAVRAGGADGIEDIMARAKIGRRAAQIRVKKQWDAMTVQGDLFAGVAA